jgi:hypothetical protein
MTETNSAEFDESHRTWLARPDIEIGEIICLAHGSPPGTFGRIADPDAQPHFRALKALIKRKLLPHYSDGSQANQFTVITLEDLLRCLALVEVASDPYYDWLRKFAERWRRYCALPAIKIDGAEKPKPRSTYDLEVVTRAYRNERSILKPFPGDDEDWKWCKAHFPGLKRQTFRDEVRKPFVPEEAQARGPRKRAAPAK